MKDYVRINLKGKYVNTRDWIDSAQNGDYWEIPCECDIEPPGFTSHVLS